MKHKWHSGRKMCYTVSIIFCEREVLASMRFTSLRLARFRNYDSLELSPHPGITVLYGPNGSGKTNLLEAMAPGCRWAAATAPPTTGR